MSGGWSQTLSSLLLQLYEDKKKEMPWEVPPEQRIYFRSLFLHVRQRAPHVGEGKKYISTRPLQECPEVSSNPSSPFNAPSTAVSPNSTASPPAASPRPWRQKVCLEDVIAPPTPQALSVASSGLFAPTPVFAGYPDPTMYSLGTRVLFRPHDGDISGSSAGSGRKRSPALSVNSSRTSELGEQKQRKAADTPPLPADREARDAIRQAMSPEERHETRLCYPCTFHHSRVGCLNERCGYCHICPPNELRRRRRRKRQERKAALVEGENRQAVTAVAPCGPTVPLFMVNGNTVVPVFPAAHLFMPFNMCGVHASGQPWMPR